jgi:hypothetical protein|tara:strand:+ start:72 stop:332 length:261 start_codon:yes stop_codon:yes gene_type:complete
MSKFTIMYDTTYVATIQKVIEADTEEEAWEKLDELGDRPLVYNEPFLPLQPRYLRGDSEGFPKISAEFYSNSEPWAEEEEESEHEL